MNTAASNRNHYTTEGVLYLAFELSSMRWQLGFTIGTRAPALRSAARAGVGQRPRRRSIEVGDLSALQREIGMARKRFGLAEKGPVVSCYEAGRDGFWLHRYLTSMEVDNLVVDSSSIEVNRRAKTDRLDLDKLLAMLIRFQGGEKQVWRVVRVPTVAEEDGRQLHRELKVLKRARTRQIKRIKGLLATQGVRIPVNHEFLELMAAARTWNGSPLPCRLRARLVRAFQQLTFTEGQIQALQAERLELIRTSEDASVQKVRQLLRLKGVSVNSAWLFTMEFFAWRGLCPLSHRVA